jgi:hypothetical protein
MCTLKRKNSTRRKKKIKILRDKNGKEQTVLAKEKEEISEMVTKGGQRVSKMKKGELQKQEEAERGRNGERERERGEREIRGIATKILIIKN